MRGSFPPAPAAAAAPVAPGPVRLGLLLFLLLGEAGSLLFSEERLWRKNMKKTKTTAMPIMAMPPTTPPTMGPTGTGDEASVGVGDVVDEFDVDVVDVGLLIELVQVGAAVASVSVVDVGVDLGVEVGVEEVRMGGASLRVPVRTSVE